MADLSLSARPRQALGRHVRSVRRDDAVPAVLYGHGLESTALSADHRTLARVVRRAGRTHLIDLAVEGSRPRKVLIRDIQVHPRSGRLLHVDLFAVNLREKISVDVPIVVVGESPAVEQKLGQLLQTMSTLHVECLPTNMPGQLTVDVSGLDEVDQAVSVAQIELPAGVELLHVDPAETVVKVAPLRVREELEEAPAAEEVEGAEGEAAGAAEAEGSAESSGEESS